MSKIRMACMAAALLLLVAPSVALAEDAADGKTLYDKKCAMCHGKDGVAKRMAAGAADLNDAAYQKATTDEALQKVIEEGAGKMKGFKDKLSADEIKLVMGHVRTLAPVE